MIEPSSGLLAGLAAVYGLLIGSFLNVVVWRVPRGESLVRPASACPHCGTPIRARDNIPVLSWLALRGRCRTCQEPISARYPLVEVVTAGAFAAVTWWSGWDLMTLVLLYAAALTIALTLIDLEHRRLPDAIVLPSYPVVTALLALAATQSAEGFDLSSFGRALLGGAALFAAYFVMALAHPRGMGFGDVKLAGVIGMILGWFGWGPFLVGFFAAFVLGGVFAVTMMIAGRATRASKVPFGPWMFAGMWLGVVSGRPIQDWYLGLIGLAG